ncbi:unnamed protein product [Symbiodinium sp. CCMP2592]|nr:unnamed protein product [Symbiodinium sp. CCMP2592]
MEDQATIWYRINETGETNVVDIPKGKMIGHLKTAIQQQNPSLDVSKITIYQSEQHFKDKKQALKPTAAIAEPHGKNGDNPLYIHYEQPSTSASSTDQLEIAKIARTTQEIAQKQDEIAERQDEIAERQDVFAGLLCRIRPASHSTWNPRWKATVMKAYGVQYCVVLHALRESWRADSPHHVWYWPFEDIKISTVGDHIFPKDEVDGNLARQCEIDVNDPRNGLPLLKHIEEKYGCGHIQIVLLSETPGGGMDVQVLVARDIKTDPIMTSDDAWHGLPRREIWLHCRRITFGDLHGLIVHLAQCPYRRSLYHKAAMAHGEHSDEFAHPSQNMETYRTGCDKMQLIERFFRSQHHILPSTA